MKRSAPKTRWSLIVILIVATVLSFLGYKLIAPKPQSAGVFLIAPASLTYGDTTISGILTKDSPVGKKGSFIVVLPDSQAVVLDVAGLDSLVGNAVEVSGMLTPGDSTYPMMMYVKSISAK